MVARGAKLWATYWKLAEGPTAWYCEALEPTDDEDDARWCPLEGVCSDWLGALP
jgi:hypothetical protein